MALIHHASLIPMDLVCNFGQRLHWLFFRWYCSHLSDQLHGGLPSVVYGSQFIIPAWFIQPGISFPQASFSSHSMVLSDTQLGIPHGLHFPTTFSATSATAFSNWLYFSMIPWTDLTAQSEFHIMLGINIFQLFSNQTLASCVIFFWRYGGRWWAICQGYDGLSPVPRCCKPYNCAGINPLVIDENMFQLMGGCSLTHPDPEIISRLWESFLRQAKLTFLA